MVEQTRSPHEQGPDRTIVVVGAGFSGVAVAVQLLRRGTTGTTVVLVNESGRMARGLAYGTRSPAHVLNVPAGNMSALPDDADHFLRYCRQTLPEVQPQHFMPRQLYGDYLESLLATFEPAAGAAGPRLRRIVGRVAALKPPQVQLADGQLLQADEVVLAFGHFAPRSPLAPADEALAGDAFIPDPWRADALARIGPDDTVLLIGAGLTAMDVALSLKDRQHQGRIVSVSRRGLAPQPHRPSGGGAHGAGTSVLPQPGGSSLRQLLAALRAEAGRLAQAGGDWRDLMVALRARTPQLWAGLSDADRGRFLRHAQPYWEVLRHRCAPHSHSAYEQLVAAGRLERLAGRVAGVRRGAQGLEVGIRPRGGRDGTGPAWRAVQWIVNCTGPTSDIRRSGSPLVQQLLADGLLCADRFGLGVQVDAHYRVLGKNGSPVPGLRYIGPLLKAAHWEATAVPELREHALRLVEELAAPASSG